MSRFFALALFMSLDFVFQSLNIGAFENDACLSMSCAKSGSAGESTAWAGPESKHSKESEIVSPRLVKTTFMHAKMEVSRTPSTCPMSFKEAASGTALRNANDDLVAAGPDNPDTGHDDPANVFLVPFFTHHGVTWVHVPLR